MLLAVTRGRNLIAGHDVTCCICAGARCVADHIALRIGGGAGHVLGNLAGQFIADGQGDDVGAVPFHT